MNKERDIWIRKFFLVLILVGTLFLSGCSSMGPTDEEIYTVGRIIHNVDENTETFYSSPSIEEYGVYTFENKLPGDSPEYYVSILFFISPTQFGAAAAHIPVAVDFTQKIYSYIDWNIQDKYNERDFELERFVMLNYIRGGDGSEQFSLDVTQEEYAKRFVPTNSERRSYSFGGNYIPGSIEVGNNDIFLRGDLIMGKNTKIRKTVNPSSCDLFSGECTDPIILESPKYEVFEDGIKVLEKPLVDHEGRWIGDDLYYFVSADKNYIVNLSIPLHYPLFNRSIVSAEFSTVQGQVDRNPPWVSSLEISPRFNQGDLFELNCTVRDDSGETPQAKVWIRSELGDWTEVETSVDSPGIDEEGSFYSLLNDGDASEPTIYPSGERIDLKIELFDLSGNKQTYWLNSVSLSEKALSIDLEQDLETLNPGSLVTFSGEISDDKGGVSNLLIRKMYNGEEIGKEYTSIAGWTYLDEDLEIYERGGDFEFEFEVPEDYSDSDSLSFVFGGAGVYSEKEHFLTGFAQTFEVDAAITKLEVPSVLYSGENEIKVRVVNVGEENVAGVVNLFSREFDYSEGDKYYGFDEEKLLDSQEVSLEVGGSQELIFNVLISARDWIDIHAEIDVDGDLGSGNNERLEEREVFNENDVGVSLETETQIVATGETSQITLEIFNAGTNKIDEVNYSLSYVEGFAHESGELNTEYEILISEGSVGPLNIGGFVEEVIDISIPEQGYFTLIAYVNASGDSLESNDYSFRQIEVLEPGSRLGGHLTIPTLFVGQEASISAEAYNAGTESSEGGKASLYFLGDYCYDSFDECGFTLIDEIEFEIDKDGWDEFEFLFIPENSGDYTLELILEAENEIEWEKWRIRNFGVIREPGPDVRISFDYENPEWENGFEIDKETPINLIVENIGTEDVSDVLVELFEVDKTSHEEEVVEKDPENKEIENSRFIDSLTIPFIGEGEKVYTGLPFTPERKGSLNLKVNGTFEGEQYLEDNSDRRDFRVFNIGPDVMVAELFIFARSSVLFVDSNIPTDIGGIIFNIGNRFAEELTTSIYVDDQLLKEDNTALGFAEIYPVRAEYFPESPGEIVLKIVADYAEDIDDSDNVLSKTFEVFDKKIVTLNIKDSLGEAVRRVIWSRLNSETVFDGEISKDIEVLEGYESEYIGIINVLGEEYEEGFLVEYNGVSLLANETIISEYYNVTEQNDTEYYFVFANKPSFSVEETVFQFALSERFTNVVGIDLDNLDEYTIYSCEHFDFLNRECELWVESEKVQLEKISFVLIDGEILSGEAKSDEKMEAFAISESLGFDGDTTDLKKIVGDIARDFVLEKRSRGRVNFKGDLNIARLKEDPELLVRHIKMKRNLFQIDTEALPEFENVSAELIFRGVQFNSPIILRDGSTCSGEICSNIDYNSISGEFSVEVSGFSEYEVVEGPYCGDNVCQESSAESCSSCSVDCGECSSNDGGRSSRRRSCTPIWECNAGLCVGHARKTLCRDLNNCGVETGRPASYSSSCIANSVCTDRDGDGYGIGVDCLGFDFDDGDAGITDIVEDPIELESERKDPLSFSIIILTVSILILIVFILILFLSRSRVKDERFARARGEVGEYVEEGYDFDQIRKAYEKRNWSSRDIDRLLKY